MRDEHQLTKPGEATTEQAPPQFGGWSLLALGMFAFFFGVMILLSPHKDSRATQAHLLEAFNKTRILRESLDDPALRLPPAGRRELDGLLSGIQKEIDVATPQSNIMAPEVLAGSALLALGILATQVGWARTAPDRKGVGFSLKRKKQS